VKNLSKRAIKNLKETMQDTIDQIDQSQLAHSVNDVNIREAIVEQPQQKSMTAFRGADKNYGAETKGRID
jgi:hypothetical protein